MKELLGDENSAEEEALHDPILVEVLAFGLHLADRLTCINLGPDKRTAFMDALVAATYDLLPPPLDHKFRTIYNARQEFYATFERLNPDDSTQGSRGTLFWEFGKFLEATYADNRIVCPTIALTAMEFMTAIMELLRSQGIFQE